MALVRISKALINDVRTKCDQMRGAEIQEVPKDHSAGVSIPASHATMRTLNSFCWGHHAHLAPMMPPDWCTKVTSAGVSTTYEHDDGDRETTSEIEYSFTADMVAPPNIETHYHRGKYAHLRLRVSFDLIKQAAEDPDHPDHEVAKEVMAVVEYEKSCRRISVAWKRRTDSLVQFLEKCKSLNEAIKLWPQVKLYVPRSYLSTVESPVVRSQAVVRKELVTEGLDSDGLTAAAIAAKLAGFV